MYSCIECVLYFILDMNVLCLSINQSTHPSVYCVIVLIYFSPYWPFTWIIKNLNLNSSDQVPSEIWLKKTNIASLFSTFSKTWVFFQQAILINAFLASKYPGKIEILLFYINFEITHQRKNWIEKSCSLTPFSIKSEDGVA